MRLFEFQAKEVFSKMHIRIPKSILVKDINALEQAFRQIPPPCVIKAQVLEGGRGKKNLVVSVNSKEEGFYEATRIYAQEKCSILIEEKISTVQEIYLSFSLEAICGDHLLMISASGGTEIEKMAQEEGNILIRKLINPYLGLLSFEANEVVSGLNIKDVSVAKQLANFIKQLYQVFISQEASLVEVNPIGVTSSGELIALDGKLILDDRAMYRHTEYPKTRAHFSHDFEYEASKEGIPYIQFDGEIGMMVAGAGLANVVLDLIHDNGGSVANYLEFGGPNYRKGKHCMEMMLRSNAKCILIVAFGTIARADVMAEGIIEAVKNLKPTIPIICSLKGTGEEKAQEIIGKENLEYIYDTETAVKRAIKITKGE